uniref:Uncharacterized protein n=1 Tax=Zea mays TaxID=4577 RepID=A0A804PIK3_MAIZE
MEVGSSTTSLLPSMSVRGTFPCFSGWAHRNPATLHVPSNGALPVFTAVQQPAHFPVHGVRVPCAQFFDPKNSSSAQHLPPPSPCARTAADPRRPPLLLLCSPQNSGSSPHLPSLRSPSAKRRCSCSPDTFPGFLAASAARVPRVRRSVQVGC